MKKLVPILFLALALLGLAIIFTACDNASDGSVDPASGSGGSLARFAITGNTLYLVSRQSLEVYDISDGGNPAKAVAKDLNFGIETIFPYQKSLFIGASDGMYIYDNTNPNDPVLLSKFTHVQSCDPVVVQGRYAYVTLRNGVSCRRGGSLSSLDVVDVGDPKQPQLVFSLPMESPYGLGVSGNRLFVCEGEKGFKIMDITDPTTPVLKSFMQDTPAYDVIVRNDHLIITGEKGLFQYRVTGNSDMKLLSKIAVL